MPCDLVRERFDNRKPKEVVNIPLTEPFAKAAIKTLIMEKKITFKRDVAKITMKDRDTLKIYIRYKGFTTLKIDDLHDMAVLFVPQPKPGSPITINDLRAHFHPKAPKDLMDKPIAEENRPWRWKLVGDTYIKEYYTPEVPVETLKVAIKKKLIMRVIEVSEVTPTPAPVKQERVLEEEEITE